MTEDRGAPLSAPQAAADPAEAAVRLEGFAASLPGFGFQRRMAPDGAISYPFFTDSVSRILGFEPGAMAVNTRGCLHVTHWADRDGHLDAVRRSATDLSSCAEEFRAITRSGEVRWLRGGSIPRRLADGTVGWDGVLVDVTEGRDRKSGV